MDSLRFFLLGTNVSGSPSPSMMNAAFAETSTNARYEALAIPAEGLSEAFARLRRQGAAGMNITIPFKRRIVGLLDELDSLSERTGAVNTVNKEGGKYVGYNTDIDGIVGPLKNLSRTFEHALLLGAGGAARAFVVAMSRMNCKRVTIVARDGKKAQALADELATSSPNIEFDVQELSSNIDVQGFNLLFNATPMGSRGVPFPPLITGLLESNQVVFDAVYSPVETDLIKAADQMGCTTIRGYEMLVGQGASAFELWTGKKAPLELMKASVLKFLTGGSPTEG